MSFYSSIRIALAHATHTTSGTSDGFDIGEFVAGTLHIYVSALSGTGARLTPRFQVSPNALVWATLRSAATSLRATGLSIMTLPALADKFGRISYTVGGTSASIGFSAYVAGKGQH